MTETCKKMAYRIKNHGILLMPKKRVDRTIRLCIKTGGAHAPPVF